jgi:hypothetical protein
LQQIHNMLSQNLQKILTEQNKHFWLTEGRNLTKHYKALLKVHGLSPRLYTSILFNDKDPTLSQLRQLCAMLEINIKDIV